MTIPPENKDPKKDKEIEHDTKIETGEEKLNGLFDYAKTNPRDVIAYVVLILGVVLLFFERFAGELLIGVIFGLYYAPEIQGLIQHFNEFIEEQGIVRGIVLGVTAIALFISAPGVFIGAILAVVIKYLFSSERL